VKLPKAIKSFTRATKINSQEIMKATLQYLVLAVLLSTVALLAGCATTESENMSERPWNSPAAGIGNGSLPMDINRGR
jgi:hypothetical protein